MAVDHYENFPVASILLPRALRAAVRDIYRFARTADDIADEGDAPAQERLAALARFHAALDRIDNFGRSGRLDEDKPANLDRSGALDKNMPAGPNRSGLGADAEPGSETPFRPDIFLPLQATIARHGLPLSLFHDLLSAFEQDVVKQRYENDDELLDYCRRSADPVGRLLLHLYERHDSDNLRRSDAICTGLQLTNFWQDVAIDCAKGRVYLPRSKREQHGVSEDWIARCTEAGTLLATGPDAAAARGWQNLMREQVEQARQLFRFGEPLCRRLPFRAGLELRLVVQGGLRILERLDQLNYDVFARRPVLRPADWSRMALRALFK